MTASFQILSISSFTSLTNDALWFEILPVLSNKKLGGKADLPALCNCGMHGMHLDQTGCHNPCQMHAEQVHTFQIQWDFSLYI
jgi:uncharacterized paraquat-inducible protein A